MLRKTGIALLLAFSMGFTVAAQSDEPADNSPVISYSVCDWGLITIEHQTAQPQVVIDITSPEAYSAVAGSSFTVSGTGAGLFEGNVVVEVRDAEGTVLFEAPTTLQAEQVDAVGDWSLDVDLSGLSEAAQLSVVAYSTSPENGDIIAFDSILLNANSEFGVRYVEITEPFFGQGVNTAPLVVSGMAGGAFENNIVIQVLDFATKDVLAETFATIQTDDMAGSGPFTTEVSFEAEPGTPVEVYAFQPDMSDGEGSAAEVSDIEFVIASPLATSYSRILHLQQNDPILEAEDDCAAAEAEFTNENITPLTINGVTVVSTRSMMPLVNVDIDAAGSSVCAAPLRVRITSESSAFAIEAYRDATEPVPCTADLAPIPLRVSLGTLPSPDFSITVNGEVAE